MIDELDLLKKDWKKNENSFQQISENEIYKMIHKKSTSIVKWILTISILEVIFWSFINFITIDENHIKTIKIYHLETFMNVFSILSYVVILVFIYLFYKSFKTISSTDSVKKLMSTIIKTKKTIQCYVWYNLGMLVFIFIVVIIFQITYDPNINKAFESLPKNATPEMFWLLLGLSYFGILLILFGIFWLFYRLVYGFLMRKLLANYNELKKIDY